MAVDAAKRARRSHGRLTQGKPHRVLVSMADAGDTLHAHGLVLLPSIEARKAHE